MTEAFSISAETGADGAFRRPESTFRHWVSADAGARFPPEAGRYHLYVARACPWAHRTLIARELMGLQEVISVSFVDPVRDARGWAFTTPGRYEDPLNGFTWLAEVYAATEPGFAGRVSVPVLWDRRERVIVNNESADVLRMLHTVFAPLARHPVTLRPAALAEAIDALNEEIYEPVNNGVYRAGFARTQAAYEQAVAELFTMLDRLDARLAETRFLFPGGVPRETDIRLFTTLVRFDAVYQIHFKCSVRKLAEYRHLWPYLRDLYAWSGFGATVSFPEIRAHYYRTHPEVNPSGIVAVMPALDFGAPAGREGLA
ncbi:MAG TPA: glutathione S-transferase C-terminal domain-containing protein [Solirubrobacteraceae bacterium]|nr:glutathione S-transferase C-terminal domain-containing protein [Solirubrobacteraceae bacterium]